MHPALTFKNWIHRHHLTGHDIALGTEHLIHDRRFWAVVGFIALFTAFVILAIVLGRGSSTEYRPYVPMYPYMP